MVHNPPGLQVDPIQLLKIRVKRPRQREAREEMTRK